MNLDFLSHIIHKFYLGKIVAVKLKAKTKFVKLLPENAGEYLWDFVSSKYFSLDKIHKELSIKEIIDKLDFIRI